MAESAAKRRTITVLKLALTVVLVVWLVRSGFLRSLNLDVLAVPSAAGLLGAALLAFLLSQMVAAARLVTLLRAIAHDLRFRDALSLTLVGAFFNLTLPGSVGGDVVKGYYLYRGEETDKGRTSGIVLADRLTGLGAMLVVAGGASFYLLALRGFSGTDSRLLVFAAALGLLALAAFPLVAFFASTARSYDAAKRALGRLLGQGVAFNLVRALGALARRPRLLAKAFGLSLLVQLLSLAGVYTLMRLTGAAGTAPLTLVAVSSLVMVAGLIPVTPGNVGWTEFVAAYGWSAAGSASGAVVFVWWRLVSVVGSLPGAAIYQLGPSKATRRKASAPEPPDETDRAGSEAGRASA